MRRRAVGELGSNNCVLCGADFGFFGPRGVAARCFDCAAYVCNKNCGVDTVTGGGQIIFLCKLCSEKRETLKKSGAWFYQTMPKYVLPEPPQGHFSPSLASPGAFQRRRLPTPPVGNGQRPAVSPTPSGHRQLPKWAEVEPPVQRGPPKLRPVKKGVENGRPARNSSSDEGSEDDDDFHRPTRRMIIQPRKFQSDSENSEPEATDDDGSVSSPHDRESLLPSPTSSQDQAPAPVVTSSSALDNVSDTPSIDSGVAQSDRSNSGGHPPPPPAPQLLVQQQQQQKGAAAVFPRPNAKQNRPVTPKEDHVVSASRPLSRTASPVLGGGQKAMEQSSPSPSSSSATTRGDFASVANAREVDSDDDDDRNVKLLSKSSDKAVLDGAKKLKKSTSSALRDSIRHLLHLRPWAESSLGILEFTVLYDASQKVLRVRIIRAQHLRAMDSNGFSDPYVKLHLLPGASKSTKLRTKTVPKTLNPEWDETLVYHGISDDDILKKSLRLTVLDEDRFGYDFLGETRVQLKRLTSGQERKFRVYLEKAMPVEKEDDQQKERGKLFLSLLYDSKKQALLVGIVRCAELLGMDASGYSDPYVKVRLRPAGKKYKFKTSVKKRTLNPEYNSEFAIPVAFTELPKKTLLITVWDKDVGKSDDFIGGLVLSGEAQGERRKHWDDCLKNPNRRFERWHKLQEIIN